MKRLSHTLTFALLIATAEILTAEMEIQMELSHVVESHYTHRQKRRAFLFKKAPFLYAMQKIVSFVAGKYILPLFNVARSQKLKAISLVV